MSQKRGHARLLVIDDDESDRELTVGFLRRIVPDAEIDAVSNGPEGLRALESMMSPGGHAAALVLIDQRMPMMTGLEVLQRMQGSGLTESVPVVLFSSAVPPSEANAVLEMGARAYVPKPIDPDEYGRVLGSIVSGYLA